MSGTAENTNKETYDSRSVGQRAADLGPGGNAMAAVLEEKNPAVAAVISF